MKLVNIEIIFVYSSLTIRASCMMNLRNLPLDTQRCNLFIGSFAYNSEETEYEWNNRSAVDIQKDLIMNQFTLINARVGKDILIRDNRKFIREVFRKKLICKNCT